MRGKLVLVVVASGVMAIGVAAGALAQTQPYAYDCFRQASASGCGGSRIVFDVGGTVTPKALPEHGLAPIGLEVEGSIANEDGSHPPALREAALLFDKNATIDAEGLPACSFRQLATRDTKAARQLCHDAIVGNGTALIGFASPESVPAQVPLTLFNGGVADGVTTLFIHGGIAPPWTAPIITAAKIKKTQKGRYGLEAIWRMPPILEGTGSVLEFAFEIGRDFEVDDEQHSYIQARCIDGRLQGNIVKAIFRNEIGPHITTSLSGTMIRPCRQRSP